MTKYNEKYYFYIVSRDYGFAPNPFHGFCTLACCKSQIRKQAKIGDWVIGLGSEALNCRGEIIYTMKVTESLNFNSYYKDKRFTFKKPIVNGSLKTMHGDNIYHKKPKTNKWIQLDSHHHHKNKDIRKENIEKDTKEDSVLISNHFFYFGNNYKILKNKTKPKNLIQILNCIKTKTKTLGSSYQNDGVKDEGRKLISFLNKNFVKNFIYGDPINWGKSYKNQFKKIYKED